MGLSGILLGACCCTLTSLSIGLAVLRALRSPLNRLECLCIGYILGAAVVSTCTLAISLLMLARKGVFLAITALSLPLLVSGIKWALGRPAFSAKAIPWFMRAILALGFLGYTSLYIRQAFTPDTSGDAMAYHLGLVNLWNHAHGMRSMPDMYAGMPQGMEMLFLFAFTIGRHSAADLIHLTFLMVLPLLMTLYGARFGFRNGSEVMAALIVYATPLVGWDGAVAYNDVALATVTFTAFYLVELWRREPSRGLLLAASAALGFSLAIKYTAIFGVLFIGAIAAWELRTRLRQFRREATLAAGILACVFAPYLARNALWYGDPVFPFANAVFPNRYFRASNEREYIEGQVHLNGVTWAEMPRELTFGGTKLPDSLGPVYVLAPIALAGLAWPASRPLALGFLAVGSACLTNKSARFLIPALPFCLLAVAFCLSRMGRAGKALIAAITTAQLVACWPPVVDKLGMPRGERPALKPWAVVLRKVPEDAYLAGASQDYVMARAIENYVPPGMSVFALAGGFAQAYTSHFVFDSYHSAQSELMQDLLYGNADSPRDSRRVWRVVFPTAKFRAFEIEQRAHSEDDWHVSEISLFLRGEQVRAPHPEAGAVPNSGDASLAVDGSQATRWKSWAPMRPGMMIEVEYPQPILADRMDVDCGEGQWNSRMRARAQDEDGKWIEPSSEEWVSMPPSDQRRSATAELKRWGIRYVLISKNAWQATRFTSRPEEWGLRAVFEGRDSKLYWIE